MASGIESNFDRSRLVVGIVRTGEGKRGGLGEDRRSSPDESKERLFVVEGNLDCDGSGHGVIGHKTGVGGGFLVWRGCLGMAGLFPFFGEWNVKEECCCDRELGSWEENSEERAGL